MSAINLGNGGTYCNGQTWYAFKPYGRSLPRLEGYKRVTIGNLRDVWARVEDRGKADRIYQCEGCGGKLVSEENCNHSDAQRFLYHVQPRYSINVPGWGSNTAGSELAFFRDEVDPAEWDRLFAFLTGN